MKKYLEIIGKYGNYITLKAFESYMGNQFFPTTFFLDDNIDNNKVVSFYKNLNENNLKYIYIHIPFCKKKCSYCYCCSKPVNNKNEYTRYLEYLIKEIKNFKEIVGKKLKVHSIYIGGGSPNILGNKLLEKIFITLKETFDYSELMEYNIDLMPYLLNKETINILKKYGLTRCTYAIQTFNEDVLNKNNRYFIKNYNHLEKIGWIKSIGMKINIDLMIGIKGQTVKDSVYDIKKCLNFNVNNITLHYLLQTKNIAYKIKNYDVIFKVKKYFDEYIIKKANSCELIQSEINENKHHELIGFGCGAITQLFGKISYYTKDLQYYYSRVGEKKIPFKKVKIMNLRFEMIKYFRLHLGFSLNYKLMNKKFGVDILKFFKEEMDFLLENKIIKIKNDMLVPIVSDLKLFAYLSIFFTDTIDIIKEKFDKDNFNDDMLYGYFTLDGQKIDGDFEYKNTI